MCEEVKPLPIGSNVKVRVYGMFTTKYVNASVIGYSADGTYLLAQDKWGGIHQVRPRQVFLTNQPTK